MAVTFRIVRNVLDDKSRLLHRRAAVLELATLFGGRSFQRTIETESGSFLRALAVVGPVPFGGRIEDFFGPFDDFDIDLLDGRTGLGIVRRSLGHQTSGRREEESI